MIQADRYRRECKEAREALTGTKAELDSVRETLEAREEDVEECNRTIENCNKLNFQMNGELDATEKEIAYLKKLMVKDLVATKTQGDALITKDSGLEDQLAKMTAHRNQLLQAEEKAALKRENALNTVKLSKVNLTNAQRECTAMKDGNKGLLRIIQATYTKDTTLNAKLATLEIKLANMTKEKDAAVMTANKARASVAAYKTAEYDLTTKVISKDNSADMKMTFLEQKVKKFQMENAKLKKEVKLYKEDGGVMVLEDD
jgi:chromosome segregation ATPase